MERTYSKEVLCWMMYDFANTAYTVIIVTFIYSVYFKNIVCEGLGNLGDLLWSISCSTSMFLAAILSPILGAIADYSYSKKRFLVFFSVFCVIFSSLLFFVEKGMIFLGMSLFILANIGFQAAIVFYNAFLPEIAPPEKLGRVSGYGWALGYLGAIFVVFISFPFLIGGWSKENLPYIRFTFLLQAAFFIIFSLPAFIGLREKGHNPCGHGFNLIKIGLKRLYDTYKHIRDYKELFKFLIAYFIYMEGITTVIFFSTIYASNTLNFSLKELAEFYIAVQTTGIIGAIIFGKLSDRIFPKRTISITLILWIIVTIGAYLAHIKAIFWIIGLLAGAAIGSSQAVSRSIVGLLTPKEKISEFFGFYGVFGKFSAIIGPFSFGAISVITGSQRVAILSVAAFFVLGFIFLQLVNEKQSIS